MDRARCLQEAKEYKDSSAGYAFVRLLNACIVDLRERNDTADADDVLRNQGAITELKSLAKQLAPVVKRKRLEFNGGFDE
jgi:hypothetical protein